MILLKKVEDTRKMQEKRKKEVKYWTDIHLKKSIGPVRPLLFFPLWYTALSSK